MSLILATPDQQTGHNTALNVERNMLNEAAEKSQELKYTTVARIGPRVPDGEQH